MFTTKLMEMIGIKGVVVIVFTIIMAVQGFAIVQYRTKVDNLNDTIKNRDDTIILLNDKIRIQNSAIEEFETTKKKAQADLEQANKQIVFLDKKGKELVNQLSKVPVAITCSAAMTELKSQSSIQVKEWNK
jgi:chromosome segregation ATPase